MASQGFQGLQFQDRAIFSKLALPLTLIIRFCPRLNQGLRLKICSNFVRSIVSSERLESLKVIKDYLDSNYSVLCYP